MLLADVYLGSLLALATVEAVKRLLGRRCQRPAPLPPAMQHKQEGYADL